jgi:hypothetical protein
LLLLPVPLEIDTGAKIVAEGNGRGEPVSETPSRPVRRNPLNLMGARLSLSGASDASPPIYTGVPASLPYGAPWGLIG